MINQFQNRGHNRSLIEQKINKAKLQEKELFLKEEKKEIATNIILSLK